MKMKSSYVISQNVARGEIRPDANFIRLPPGLSESMSSSRKIPFNMTVCLVAIYLLGQTQLGPRENRGRNQDAVSMSGGSSLFYIGLQ